MWMMIIIIIICVNNLSFTKILYVESDLHVKIHIFFNKLLTWNELLEMILKRLHLGLKILMCTKCFNISHWKWDIKVYIIKYPDYDYVSITEWRHLWVVRGYDYKLILILFYNQVIHIHIHIHLELKYKIIVLISKNLWQAILDAALDKNAKLA